MKTTKPSSKKAPAQPQPAQEGAARVPLTEARTNGEKQLADLQGDLAAVEKAQSRPRPRRTAQPVERAAATPPAREAHASLAVIENRLPITLAFERCLHLGLAGPEIQDQWKEDLTNALIQGAKKFVGFDNVVALRKALDINLGLISIALLIRTEGQPDVEAWAELIQKVTVTDLIGETLSHLKALVYERGYLFAELYEAPPRETLLALATACDPKRKSLWIGYDRFLQEKRSRKNLHTTDQLARFLIECLLRKNPKAWVEWKTEGLGNKNAEPNVPLAEEVTNTLILRYCTLKPGETIPENIDLQASYISRLRSEYEAGPQAWLAGAKTRFDHLLKLLSPEMREHLLEKDWFATHLSAGPPKPVKVSKRKKPRPDDDDDDAAAPPAFIDIAGVSGIYCYDIYA